MDAIIYKSNCGTTEHYAEILSEKLGLPAYCLDDSPLQNGANIIYLGWIMASVVKGYKKASKLYNISAVCGVGMGQTGSQISEIRKANHISTDICVFTLQGGFDINKLHGIYKFMMNTMSRTVGKKLSKKTDRTPEEDEALDMFINGKDCVKEENVNDIIDWFHKNI